MTGRRSVIPGAQRPGIEHTQTRSFRKPKRSEGCPESITTILAISTGGGYGFRAPAFALRASAGPGMTPCSDRGARDLPHLARLEQPELLRRDAGLGACRDQRLLRCVDRLVGQLERAV